MVTASSSTRSSMSSANSQSTPPFAREVIALYAEALPDVRFPDLDLALLERSAEELHEAELAVVQATLQLEAAREAAYRQAELLATRTERALAYARVFADGNTQLSERIARLATKTPASASESVTPKRRGRPKKSESDVSLFRGGEDTHTAEDASAAPAM